MCEVHRTMRNKTMPKNKVKLIAKYVSCIENHPLSYNGCKMARKMKKIKNKAVETKRELKQKN